MNEENFSPSQPVLEPEKNNAKLVIVIAIIVAIVAITAGVIGFLLAKKTQAPAEKPVAAQPVAQTADETVGWKTYTNNAYNYEIRYPVDWYISDNKFAAKGSESKTISNYENPDQYTQTSLDQQAPAKPSDFIAAGISVEITNDSLDKFCVTNEAVKVLKRTEQTINGTNFILCDEITMDHPSGIEIIRRIFKNDNKIYNLSYVKKGIVSEDTLNKILATFKFTNTVTDETADWKTYKNTENNFEIKYPLGWKTNQANVNQVEFYNSENPKNDYLFRIDVVKNLNKSLNVWLKDNIQDANVENQSVSVAGIEALKFISLPSTQAPGNIEYCFIKNNVGYILTTAYIDTSNGIGEKILSTFKFTN